MHTEPPLPLLRLERALRAGQYREVLRAAEAIRRDPGLDADTRARAALFAADAHRILGQPDQATHATLSVLDHAEEQGQETLLTAALVRLARLREGSGDLGAAMALYRRVLELKAEPENTAHAVLGLAMLDLIWGHSQRAQDHLEEAHALVQVLPDDHPARLQLHLQQGWLDMVHGQLGVAARRFEQVHRRSMASGQPMYTARALGARALALIQADEIAQAEPQLERQLALFMRIGHVEGVARALVNLGEVRRMRGQLTRAEADFGRAIRSAPDSLAAGTARVNLALLLLQRGALDAADKALEPLRHTARASPTVRGAAHLGALVVAARRADGPRFDEVLAVVRDEVPRMHDRQAHVLDLAFEAAQAAYRSELGRDRAADAASLALELVAGGPADGRASWLRAHLRRLRADGAPVPLGSFRLGEAIGEGSCARVYRAVGPAGETVAIKVLVAGSARSRALLRELRAVAALDHPHVVTLIHQGTVTDAAAAMDPTLPAGAPWLAVELAPGGSLAPWCGRMDWPTIRTVLLELLAGLAHAHARGLLHLDLKPGNVLLRGKPDERSAMLADFGLAMTLHEADGTRGVKGTPAYMAPEQFVGDPVAFGPATDLYGIGALAVAMLTGKPPFGRAPGRGTRAVGHKAHLPGPCPRLEGDWHVPPGFDAWLARMLAHDPADRFDHAADAAAVLRTLDPPERAPRWEVRVSRERLPSTPGRLALFGLRPARFVGRVEERAQLWCALQHVIATGRCQGVVVEGRLGNGISRLTRWLAEQAVETGVAAAVRTEHVQGRSSRTRGIAGLLVHALRAGRLQGDALQRRIGLALHEMGVEEPSLAPRIAGIIEGTCRLPPTRRWRLCARLLEAIARRRPLVLVVDDAQWGPELVAVARMLIGTPRPILLVLGVARDAPVHLGRPLRDTMLEQLLGAPDTIRVELGPLPPDEHEALLDGLLPLAAGLRHQLAARTRGHPGFAVDLVADLVARGELVASPAGFCLADGASVRLPGTTEGLWRRRVDHVLRGLEPSAGPCLQLAAILGHDVDEEVWRRAARFAGLPLEALDPLVHRLLQDELALPTPFGWTFGNGPFREALLKRCRDQGSWGAFQRASANALRSQPGASAVALAHHLQEAGELAAAIGALQVATEAALSHGRHQEIVGLLDRCEQLLAMLGVTPLDPRARRLRLLRARQLCELGRPADAVPILEDLTGPVAHTDVPTAEAYAELGRALRLAGDGERAESVGARAITVAAATRDATALALALRQHAITLVALGDPRGSTAWRHALDADRSPILL